MRLKQWRVWAFKTENDHSGYMGVYGKVTVSSLPAEYFLTPWAARRRAVTLRGYGFYAPVVWCMHV